MIMFNTSGIADVLDFLQLQQYCIIMMTEDKNDYYMTASTHNKMYELFLFTFTRNCQMVTIHYL